VLNEPLPQRIVRHASRLFLSEVASRVLTFITTVYLARTLHVAGFGLLAYAQALLGYLTVVCDWGLSTYGTRAVASAPGCWPRVWVQVARLRASLAFVLTAAALATVWVWSKDGTTRVVVAVTLLAAVPASLMPDWVLRGLERMGWAAIFVVAQAALTLLGVVVVVRHASDLPWVPTVRLASALSVAGAGILVLRWMDGGRRGEVSSCHRDTSPAMQEMITSGTILLAANLAVMVYSNVDVVMLRAVLKDDMTVGWYSGAQRIIQLPMSAFYTLTVAALPVLTRTVPLGDGVFAVTLRPLIGVAALAGAATAIGLWVWRDTVVRLVLGGAFAPAVAPLAFLAFAVPLDFLVAVKGTSYIARGWEAPAMVCVAIAAGAKVVLNLLFIPRLGMIGAAWATLGAYGVLLATYLVVLDRRHRS
jgi:O-antigen/teichoic acid export membrane protein